MAAASSTQAAAPAWRQFPFFDVNPVKDAHDLSKPPDILKNAPEISVLTSSSAGILLADIYGSIHLLNKDFESVHSWIGHVNGRVTHMEGRRGILITIGDEESSPLPLLNVWDLTKIDNKTDRPTLLRSVKIQHGSRPHPVSTIALSASMSHLAIGLADGTVLLYRQLDQSLSPSGSLTSLPKPRLIYESPGEPITGLGFREPSDGSPFLYLFIVTINHVLSYIAHGKGSGAAPITVDEIGAALGCAVMDWKGEDIILARDEAIYLCNTEARGPSVAYEGYKSSIHTHRNYLVIVSPPFFPSAASTSATVRNFVARNPATADNTDISKVTVFDLQNKFVAHTGPFNEGVRAVVSQWGNIYILCNDGQLYRLEEKPTPAKLDMLYRRNQFGVALNMAKTQGLDESSKADIHRQYGDHLYNKGDYDGAMQQYIQTIRYLQPSYVIRKFLDAQRIHNLVTYLQELHSLGLANADHTTLLLNTYTKLKDVARLDSFIKTESRTRRRPTTNGAGADDEGDGMEGAAEGELPFDLETAIRVCRQAGYFEHASYLAKKYHRHEDYLRIQVEDNANYKDALLYLRDLDPEATESNLARYGRVLLANMPDETTHLLIDICTGSVAASANTKELATPTPKQGGPSYLSYLGMNRAIPIPGLPASSDTTVVGSPAATSTTPATATTSTAVDVASSSSSKTDHSRTGSVHGSTRTASPTPTTTTVKASSVSTATAKDEKDRPKDSKEKEKDLGRPNENVKVVDKEQKEKKEKRPSPRLYFATFVEHMDKFVVFLEAVALRRWGQSVDTDAGSAAAPLIKPSTSRSSGDTDELNEKQDQIAVWNTLLELYLTLMNKEGEDGTAETQTVLREKVMRLLKSETIPYDVMHALILCSTRSFMPGLVLLWEKLGMYEDILRFWMDKAQPPSSDPEASSKVLECLDRYGAPRPHLYPLVLRFLTSSPALLTKHERDLARVLEHIEREKIMPPLGVVQVLSRNGVASVGLVKGWLMQRIKESRDEIDADRQLTTSYREETASKQQLVKELSDPDHPRVFHVTRCSACSGALDLPAIHFMCGHSYHQRCIAENEAECPNCASRHGVIREIRRNNEALADRHDLFLAEVKENGFNAVASAFGRGLMRMPRADEASAIS